MKRYKLTVFGKVQGVGYRYHTIMMARAYNVRGFVQNLSNGSVLIEGEGEGEDLNRFINECIEGPITAYVAEHTKKEITYQGDAHFLKR